MAVPRRQQDLLVLRLGPQGRSPNILSSLKRKGQSRLLTSGGEAVPAERPPAMANHRERKSLTFGSPLAYFLLGMMRN
jgi:hypothetical protein